MEAVNYLPFAAISGYVTVLYDGSCWLGYVLGSEESDRVVIIKFLHPCIPAASFVYPDRDDVVDIDPSDILTYMPNNCYGSNICLKYRKEMQEATLALTARL